MNRVFDDITSNPFMMSFGDLTGCLLYTSPAYDKDGNLIYDYIVKKVARSLNTVSFAVSKVAVS